MNPDESRYWLGNDEGGQSRWIQMNPDEFCESRWIQIKSIIVHFDLSNWLLWVWKREREKRRKRKRKRGGKGRGEANWHVWDLNKTRWELEKTKWLVRSRVRPCHKSTKYPVCSFFSSWDYLIYYRNNNNNKTETAQAVIMVVDMVYSSKIAVRESTFHKPPQGVEPERAEQTPDQ